MKFISLIIFCIVLLAGCNPSEKEKHNQVNQSSETEPAKSSENVVDEQPEEQEETVTIEQVVSKAKAGQALDIPFLAHKHTITDVKKAWGEPDQVDFVANSYYATYTSKHAVFGYTKTGRIFDARSYEPSIQSFSLSDIEQVLGDPQSTAVINNDKIYIYVLNKQFQLKWIIPAATGKVDHISVYSAADLTTKETGSTQSPYLLSIKGTSQKLSSSAWNSMVQWRQEILAFPKSYPNEVFVNGPNKKRVALTFDDGPDLINTPKIIEALKEQNVKGTFFFIGQKVQKYPDVVKAAFANGNVVASHSFYHHELPKQTAAEIHQDLAKTSEAIRKVIGRSPALLRPPYGETDVKLVNAAKEDQYKLIIWSIDTLDWSQMEQAHIQKNVFDNIRNGDIILMHSDDNKTETAKAVPGIIKELKRRGFEIVDVATLLNTKAYK